jgi:hypothetical protein
MRAVLDMAKLLEIERNMPGRVETMMAELAFTCVGEAVDNFSTTSPSPAGEPPGIDTGTLKNAVNAQPAGPMAWEVNDGTDYGVHQEYGTRKMPARPWMLPAFERAVATIDKDMLLEVIADE